MGKRNKGEQKDDINVTVKKKRFKTIALSEEIVNVKNDVTKEISNIKKSTGNGKNQKIVFDTEESHEKSSDINNTKKQHNIKSEKKRNQHLDKQNKNVDNDSDYNDEPSDLNESTKIKKNIEEPEDEEIDKFCDELDEEDNVQYENWVKLIDAKLSTNKKK